MLDDPHTYDITEFAREFTWSIVFWNLAENHARWLLSGILGGHEAVLALVADLGSRTLNEALLSAARGLEDQEIRKHVDHFCKGFGRLGEHRNLYIHGLMSMDGGQPNSRNERPLHGRIMKISGKGRLRSIDMDLPTSEIIKFKKDCLSLLSYGKAISNELGLGDDTFEKILNMPRPSLDMPTWPESPKKNINYIQQ